MKRENKNQPLDFDKIEKIFDVRFEDSSDKKPEWYCESSELSLEDQKWVWDNILHDTQSSELVLNDNDVCKRKINSAVNDKTNDIEHKKGGLGNINDASKHDIILELRKCHYRSSPKKIASLLEKLFINWPAKSGHWSYVAQNWTPRQINWEISNMVKLHQSGYIIKNPAKFFTFMMQKRKRRKRRKRG